MFKIVSENFIHALLLFLGLFLKISRWVPLTFEHLHGITHNTLLSSFYWIAQTSSNFGQHYLDMKNWLGDLGQSEKENIVDK